MYDIDEELVRYCEHAESVRETFSRDTANYYSNIFTVGFSVLALDGMAYLVRRWRSLQLYVTLPFFLLAFPFAFLIESPRWLLSTGKVESAEKMLRKIARFNRRMPFECRLRGPESKKESFLANHTSSIWWFDIKHFVMKRFVTNKENALVKLDVLTFYHEAGIFLSLFLKYSSNLVGRKYLNVWPLTKIKVSPNNYIFDIFVIKISTN